MILDRMKHPFIALLAGALIFGASKANAADVYWSDLTADYTNGPSWAGGFAPGAADRGGVSNGGTIQITSNITVAEFFIVSPGGDFAGGLAGPGPGTVDHTAGVARFSEWLAVGRQAGGLGTYNQSAGTTVEANRAWVGMDGGAVGEYNITGAALNANLGGGGEGLQIGLFAGSVGTVNATDATINASHLVVGNEGTGTLNQVGGSTVNTTWTDIGGFGGGGASGVGTYNLSGGGTFHGDGEIHVGREGTGVFNQDGGSVTSNGWLDIGRGEESGINYGASSSGTFNLSGGGVTDMVAELSVGRLGTGKLSIDGSGNTFSALGLHVASDYFDVDANPGTAGGTGTLEFIADASGITSIVLDGFWDDVSGVPDVLLGANANLNVDLSAMLGGGDVLLVDNLGVEPINGIFAGLPEGAVVPGSGGRFITYVGGSGNDIELLAIPEPASVLLIGLGGVLLCGRRRQS